jgi:hypothetical protein
VFGGGPNLNKQKATGSGRLNGIGRFHLQRTPKNARRLLFRGSGYWSYDFKGCHWYITQALCRHYGIHSPVIDGYLTDKTRTELAVAERLELPERNGKSAKAKALLLGLLMKRVLTTSPYSPLATEIGTQSVKLAQKDAFIRALEAELKPIRKAIIKHHSHQGIVSNALGKTKPLRFIDKKSGKSKKTSEKELFSHILQGYEAWALNALLKTENDTLLLLFDGWISEHSKSTTELEEKLRNLSSLELGFPLLLEISSSRL